MWSTAEPVVGAWIAENLGPVGRLEDVERAGLSSLAGFHRRRCRNASKILAAFLDASAKAGSGAERVHREARVVADRQHHNCGNCIFANDRGNPLLSLVALEAPTESPRRRGEADQRLWTFRAIVKSSAVSREQTRRYGLC